MKTITLEAGRGIAINGTVVAYLHHPKVPCDQTTPLTPTEMDTLARVIVRLLDDDEVFCCGPSPNMNTICPQCHAAIPDMFHEQWCPHRRE